MSWRILGPSFFLINAALLLLSVNDQPAERKPQWEEEWCQRTDEISKEARVEEEEEEEEVGENLEVEGDWLTTAPLHLRVLLQDFKY